MKDNQKNKSIFLLVLVIIYVLIVSFFIMPYHKKIYLPFSLTYFLICLIIGIFLFKITCKKSKSRYDTIQIVVLSTLFYLVITYLSGLFLGFNRNPLSLQLSNIIKNLIVYGTIISSEEFIRYNIIKNYRKNKIILVLTIIIFTWLNLVSTISVTNFNSNIELFKFISKDLLPIISVNILLTYIASKTDYIPNIIYRFIMELVFYIVPIFPDLGLYLESIIKLIFPATILFKLNLTYIEENKLERRVMKSIGVSKIVLAIVILITLSITLLISGIFKYQLISIASNSMYPIFQRGDAVIFEKKSSVGIEDIEKGNIIIYNSNNGISVVHRIINIERKNNTNVYTLKGDNNEIADKEKVYEKQIIGVVKLSIPKIGYPSVWVSEQLSK